LPVSCITTNEPVCASEPVSTCDWSTGNAQFEQSVHRTRKSKLLTASDRAKAPHYKNAIVCRLRQQKAL